MQDLDETIQTKLERLERYVAKVEAQIQTLQDDISKGTFETFNEQDIQFQLAHAPDLIADTGLFLAKIQRAYDYAKLNTKITYAGLWKETISQKDRLPNAKDREAFVISNPDYRTILHQEYEWKYNVSRAQIIYDRYQNLFTSVRKLANLLPQYYEAQTLSTKYQRAQ